MEEIKILTGVAEGVLHEAFVEAFSDYLKSFGNNRGRTDGITQLAVDRGFESGVTQYEMTLDI